MVADINRRTGESECQYYKDRLLYTEDGQRDELIDLSKTLSCHGELKNNRGLVSRCPPLLSFLTITFPHACLPVSAEAPRLSVPGCPGHHQVRLLQRSAAQLPAVPPANPNQAAGPGGPRRRGDASGGVHTGGLQQHRAESVHLTQH